MFQVSSLYHRLTALLIPAVLLCSWAACILTCSDVAERAGETNTIQSVIFSGETECVDASHCLDDCALTITPATFQERQTVPSPPLRNESGDFLPLHKSAFASFRRVTDINQHSPPKIASPIFLRLCSFRI